MLFLLTLVVIAIVTIAFWREGALTAFAMTCNVFLAGLVAFNFWEPLASELEPLMAGSVLAGFEDVFCLMLLFGLTLGVLRMATNNLANRQLDYPPVLQQGCCVVCAVLTGYLVAGFLLCMIQTIPLNERFLNFEPGSDPQEHRLRRILPPDRVWLALMHRASLKPFASSEPIAFDPDGSFEIRYARLRRYREAP